MGKSKETFGKKEKEKKRLKKKKEKQQKKEERKASSKGGSLDDMIAYVDEHGNITDTPPDPANKKKFKKENIEVSIPKQSAESRDKVRRGRIDFFNDTKGYGFIKEADTGESFFVHVNGLKDDVREGDKVSFELERGPKGMNAVNVRKT